MEIQHFTRSVGVQGILRTWGRGPVVAREAPADSGAGGPASYSLASWRGMKNPVRASLLVTCLVDLFYPEIGVAIVTLLRRLGVAVDFPPGQTCCGLPLFNSGYHEEAARVARRMIPLFSGSEHVVVPSGSCAWMIKKEYPGLVGDDPAVGAQARTLAERTHEIGRAHVTPVTFRSRMPSSA